MSVDRLAQGEGVVSNSLVLPITKFSYATTAIERTSPLGWTHLSGGGDLVAIFDHIRIHELRSGLAKERTRLQVRRGTESLSQEELDLGLLAQEAADRSTCSSAQKTKLPIAVIVKSPCLAVRYPTPINQIRRFQIKFSSDADYYKALSILSEVGCPITESTPGPAQHPSARPLAPAIHMGLGTLALGSGLTGSVHASTYPSVDDSRGTIISPATLEASNALQVNVSSNQQIASASSFRRNCGQYPPLALSTLPSVIARSGATEPGLYTPDPVFPHGSPSSVPQDPELTSAEKSPPSDTDFQQPEVQFMTNRRHTALSPVDVESLNQILPPKRKLPFAKAASTQRQHPPQQDSASHGREPTDARSPVPHTSPVPQIPAAAANTAKGLVSPFSVPTIPAGKHGIAVEPSCGTSLMVSHHQECMPETKQPQNLSIPPQKGSLVHAPEQYQAEEDSGLRKPFSPFQATGASTRRPQIPAESAMSDILSSPDLKSYLSTPAAERSARLESWICQQLESDGFLALCQDIEGTWKRIAFGY